MYDDHGQKIQKITLKDENHPEVPIHEIFVIKNFFGRQKNKEIYDYTMKYANCFFDASITGERRIDKNIRSNSVMYADNVFMHDRKIYPLLRYMQEMYASHYIHQLFAEHGGPYTTFSTTTISETQVSRYGNNGQKYDWHVDTIDNSKKRYFTWVYYMFKEPKRFTGGEISFANVDKCIEGKLISKYKPVIKTIIPENDMGVFFVGTTAHCVSPTKSPEKFELGRFSVNSWIGWI